MISIDTLLYEIDQRINKLANNAHQQISLEDKVIAISNGEIELIKQKIGGPNTYGLDSFKKRYQDLQFLIENYEDHPLSPVPKNSVLNRWIVNISSLSPKFMFYLDSYMIADKVECKSRKINCNTSLIKHSDINFLLNNTNYSPSFEYQETIADISVDELHYYTDGTFTPTKIYLSYLRYPKLVSPGNFEEIDGTISVKQDSELEEYLKDELLNIVCLNLGFYTENPGAVEAASSKIKIE